MTFWAGYRAMRSIDPCPKCGGDKTPQRAESPTGVLRSPKRRTGAEHILFVMCNTGEMGRKWIDII